MGETNVPPRTHETGKSVCSDNTHEQRLLPEETPSHGEEFHFLIQDNDFLTYLVHAILIEYLFPIEEVSDA